MTDLLKGLFIQIMKISNFPVTVCSYAANMHFTGPDVTTFFASVLIAITYIYIWENQVRHFFPETVSLHLLSLLEDFITDTTLLINILIEA